MECDYQQIYRFNARVLEEGPCRLQGPDSCFPEQPLNMAFAATAAPLLEQAGIDMHRSAGGVQARLDAAALARINSLQNEEGLGLAAAVKSSRAGWGRNRYSWKIGPTKSIGLGDRTKLIGIVNVTPDSFSDGGRFLSKEAAVRHALALLENGADLIDVGGESTRPGAGDVDAKAEIERTVPVIEAIRKQSDAVISIDTTKAAVAAAALDAGAQVINDISGLSFDPEMISLAAHKQAGVVIMHIQGRPRDMQTDPHYDDTVAEVALGLRGRVLQALKGGIEPERIVLDPGIGFGKRFEDNLRLLAALGELRSLAFPLLLGCSRKSFLGRITGREAPERVLETCATSVLAALAGIQMLRVHDVAENRMVLDVAQAIVQARRS